jgi:hypothetical protein
MDRQEYLSYLHNMNPLNPSFAAEVERSFARQPVMNLIGAALSLVEPGVVGTEVALFFVGQAFLPVIVPVKTIAEVQEVQSSNFSLSESCKLKLEL